LLSSCEPNGLSDRFKLTALASRTRRFLEFERRCILFTCGTPLCAAFDKQEHLASLKVVSVLVAKSLSSPLNSSLIVRPVS
ncbi:hypothetical protein M378DRAFT_190443, partial [Amanita muscaria Koide BX008]